MSKTLSAFCPVLHVLIAIGCCFCCTAHSETFNADQNTALRVINYYRKLAGLPKARLDARLCRAAQRHADYRLQNTNLREDAHTESANAHGFTGESFTDRLRAAGYDLQQGSFGECISEGENTAVGSVDALIRVPYHRIEYLLGGSMEVGIGVATGNASGSRRHYKPTVWVYDIAGATGSLAVWPPEDSTGVPTVGGTDEIPDPLRIHEGARAPGGYVISMGFEYPYYQLSEAKLTTQDGKPVPTYVNYAGNDPFSRNCALLIPREVLHAFTTYVVELKLTSHRGGVIDKRWKFVTGTQTYHFEYAAASGQFPEILKGGKRYRGIVSSVSDNKQAVNMSDVQEDDQQSKSAATHLPVAATSATRNYAIDELSRLHASSDPLGVDRERVVPHSGERVTFTTDPVRPSTIKDLLIMDR